MLQRIFSVKQPARTCGYVDLNSKLAPDFFCGVNKCFPRTTTPMPLITGASLTAILGISVPANMAIAVEPTTFFFIESLRMHFVQDRERRPVLWMSGYQSASRNWLFVIVLEPLMVATFLLSM